MSSPRRLLVSLWDGEVRSESIGGIPRSGLRMWPFALGFDCERSRDDVQDGRIRSAGFRCVLYVEPKDVYLSDI